MQRSILFVGLFVALAPALVSGQQSREQKVRGDKVKVEAEGFWIYNDLAKAFAEAQKTARPLLVVLRCLPCEQCVKLDDDLIDHDERLRPLLEQFVRVRVISANGLDLSLFQFDTDQSFAVFLLNPDGTIYGRFGTRSDREHWTDDVSIEGLSKALEGALALHREYPHNKAQLTAKRGPSPDFSAPEKYPTLAEKYGSQINYEGNVVQSCIHCHQIGDAQRQYHRATSGSISEQVLFPYPHPKAIGLILDPKQRATVLRVEEGSLAATAGFQAGDDIQSLAGQPPLSIADVQWVLHHVPADGGGVEAVVKRGAQSQNLTLNLPSGWRRKDDIAWRASTWQFRRMALGAMNLEPLTADEKAELKLPAAKMAFKVKHVGQFAPHDRAKKAGVVAGDILVSFAGRNDLLRETDLIAYGLNRVKVGDPVELVMLRNGEQKTFTITTAQ